jgi:hypothetical protein
MNLTHAVRFRLAGAALLLLPLALVLSQWLGSRAWQSKLDDLYAWAHAVEAAPPGTVIELPHRPHQIVFRAASEPAGEPGALYLTFRRNPFLWLSLLGPESSYDSALISVRSEGGRLLVKIHYGSD